MWSAPRLAALGLFVWFAAVPARADDTLATARDLYAEAAYADALAMLDRLSAEEGPPGFRRIVAQYRAFCLLALNRIEEAEHAAADAIAADPFFDPEMLEASPRVQSIFREVRRRVLPEIVQARYTAARDAFARRDHQKAADGFREVLLLLEDPETVSEERKVWAADLRILAAEFLELSEASRTAATNGAESEPRDTAALAATEAAHTADPATSPGNAPAPTTPPAESANPTSVAVGTSGNDSADAPSLGGNAALPSNTTPPVSLGTSGGTNGVADNTGSRPGNSGPGSTPTDTTGPAAPASNAAAPAAGTPTPPVVRQPVAIVQRFPDWPFASPAQSGREYKGSLEVDIDVTGKVTGARILESVNAAYDPRLIEAALGWRYTPALVDGRPMPITKVVTVVVRVP